MNTRNKILIDRFLGSFIAFPLNFLVRFVGFFAGIDHSLKSDKNRIVICKFKGMGSIIQSTPLIQTLRAKYPEATIIYVSSIENKALLERIKIIDEVYLVNDRHFTKLITSSVGLIFKFWRKKTDLYIDLEIYSNYSSLITTFSLSTDRFGYYLNSSKYRMGLYTHMMFFNTDTPIPEVYLQFARLLGCKDIIMVPYEIERDESILIKHSNYVIVNPNASDLRIERRWPKQFFVELIHSIRIDHPELNVLLIGSPSEAEYVGVISKHFIEDDSVVDLSGKTSLTELIEYIRNAQFTITNDTGPMHISGSLKKRTLALFGPCSPNQYAIGEYVYPIYKNLYCSPCVHEFIIPPCKGNNQCMKSIKVEEVLDAMNSILSGKTKTVMEKTKQYVAEHSYPLGLVVRKKV